jgi:predicted ribosome quality control (RQC) complex YloA/Tae2 family protein
MAKKASKDVEETTEVKEEKKPKKEVKKYKVKDEKELGFRRRHYHTGEELVLIIAGKEYDEETYNQFNHRAKAIFFES